MFRLMVRYGIRSGTFRSLDPDMATLSLIGIIDGLGVHASLGNENVTIEKMRQVVSYSIRALLAR